MIGAGKVTIFELIGVETILGIATITLGDILLEVIRIIIILKEEVRIRIIIHREDSMVLEDGPGAIIIFIQIKEDII